MIMTAAEIVHGSYIVHVHVHVLATVSTCIIVVLIMES